MKKVKCPNCNSFCSIAIDKASLMGKALMWSIVRDKKIYVCPKCNWSIPKKEAKKYQKE